MDIVDYRVGLKKFNPANKDSRPARAPICGAAALLKLRILSKLRTGFVLISRMSAGISDS